MSTTQPYVHGPDEGRAVWSLGALLVIKADAGNTDGAFTLYESLTAAGVSSPWHVHAREDELFYVLSGEVECVWGEEGANRTQAGPGATAYLPRGVPHGFRVVGEEPCRMLVQLTPGGLEGFFEAVGRPAEELELPPTMDHDIEEMIAVAEEYDLEILGRLPSE